MKLLHSGLYVYNLDPVRRYDRGRQYELQVDVAQLANDSGPFHAARNSLPLSQWSESRRNPFDEWAHISNLLNIDFAYP